MTSRPVDVTVLIEAPSFALPRREPNTIKVQDTETADQVNMSAGSEPYPAREGRNIRNGTLQWEWKPFVWVNAEGRESGLFRENSTQLGGVEIPDVEPTSSRR